MKRLSPLPSRGSFGGSSKRPAGKLVYHARSASEAKWLQSTSAPVAE